MIANHHTDQRESQNPAHGWLEPSRGANRERMKTLSSRLHSNPSLLCPRTPPSQNRRPPNSLNESECHANVRCARNDPIAIAPCLTPLDGGHTIELSPTSEESGPMAPEATRHISPVAPLVHPPASRWENTGEIHNAFLPGGHGVIGSSGVASVQRLQGEPPPHATATSVDLPGW
jgi:hypothetical protein